MTDKSESFLLLTNGNYVNLRHIVSVELTDNRNYYSIFVSNSNERVGLVSYEDWNSIVGRRNREKP